MTRTRLAVMACMAAASIATFGQAGPAGDDTARRRYEQGVAFMDAQKFQEALKDFQAIVDQYPASQVADDALLQIARYQLDVAHDVDAAAAAAEALVRKYEQPWAHILVGRVALARRRTPESIDTALASFERAVKLFPGSEAAPIALLDTATALDAARRQEEALAAYRRVTTQFPQTLWAIRAELGAARALVRLGETARALEVLGRVRARYGNRGETAGPELANALAWSTLLYRLHVRPTLGQPPYAPSGRTLRVASGRLEDVVAVAVDRAGNVYAAREQGVSSFKPDGTFAVATAAQDVRNLTTTPDGGVAIVRKGGVAFVGQATPVQLSAARSDKTIRPLEDIPAGGILSTGELLIADRETRSILRFTSDGKHVGRFGDGDPVRMAVDSLDNVAMLDRETRDITVMAHDGRPVGKVPRRGTNYEFRNPVDIAFDALAHLYVLDRDSGTVFVFNPQWQLATQFSLPENAPGAFRRARAFGVDSVGRLYIFDDRGGLQVYQ